MRILIAFIALTAACSYGESVGSSIAQRSDANLFDGNNIDAIGWEVVWTGILGTGIAVHGADAYFVDVGGQPSVVHVADREGEMAGFLPAALHLGPGIAADADHVYVGAQLGIAEWGVLAFDVHSSATTFLLAGVAEPIGEIGVAHGQLYYLTSPNAAPFEMAGALRAVPLGGGASTTVIGQLSAPTRIRFDDNYVYVTDAYLGQVLASGAQGTLVVADHLQQPNDVTFDGDDLYIVERALQDGQGRISRVPRPAAGAAQADLDTTAVVRVSGLNLPMDIVVEGGMLRWSAYDGGLQTAPLLGGAAQTVLNQAGPGYGPLVLRTGNRLLMGVTSGNHSYVTDWIPND